MSPFCINIALISLSWGVCPHQFRHTFRPFASHLRIQRPSHHGQHRATKGGGLRKLSQAQLDVVVQGGRLHQCRCKKKAPGLLGKSWPINSRNSQQVNWNGQPFQQFQVLAIVSLLHVCWNHLVAYCCLQVFDIYIYTPNTSQHEEMVVCSHWLVGWLVHPFSTSSSHPILPRFWSLGSSPKGAQARLQRWKLAMGGILESPGYQRNAKRIL